MIPQFDDTPEEDGRGSNTALAKYNTPSLLSLNLDWLTVSVDEELPEHILSYLSALAADCCRDVPAIETHLSYRGADLLLSRTALGELVLKNDYLRLCVSSPYDRQMGMPAVQVALYSPCFWSAGTVSALAELQAWCDDLWAFHALPLRPSRVDVSLDLKNAPMPSVSEYSAFVNAFVRRSKVHRNIGNDQAIETIYLGSAKAAVKLRIYNKSLEMRKHGKDYYVPMWSENGYVEGDVVTRYEWQLGSGFLREWLGSDGSRVQTLSDLRSMLPAIFKYLTRSWVRHTVPSETDTNRNRWETSAFWQVVQRASWSLLVVPVEATRQGERKLQLERLKAQMFGCLKSVLALVPSGDQYDVSEIMQGLYRMMADYERDRQEPFQLAVWRRKMELAKVA